MDVGVMERSTASNGYFSIFRRIIAQKDKGREDRRRGQRRGEETTNMMQNTQQ